MKLKYIKKKRNYVLWIQTAMVYIKEKTFTQTQQGMLELDLKLQVTTETDHYVKDKIKK